MGKSYLFFISIGLAVAAVAAILLGQIISPGNPLDPAFYNAMNAGKWVTVSCVPLIVAALIIFFIPKDREKADS